MVGSSLDASHGSTPAAGTGATCLPGSVLLLPRVPGFFLLRAHGVWSVEALWQEQKSLLLGLKLANASCGGTRRVFPAVRKSSPSSKTRTSSALGCRSLPPPLPLVSRGCAAALLQRASHNSPGTALTGNHSVLVFAPLSSQPAASAAGPVHRSQALPALPLGDDRDAHSYFRTFSCPVLLNLTSLNHLSGSPFSVNGKFGYNTSA